MAKPAVKKKAKLTDKQELFCKEYLIDLNATQAAFRAGYSEKTANKIGSENLAKPDIADYIQQLADERSKRVEIDADWVLKASIDLYHKCMEAETVQDHQGNDMGFAKFNPAGAAKAIELAGKHINVQAFNERVTNENNNKNEDVSKITVEVVG